jgi:pimeloyl-ACP methyl ester carboxylesterase
MPAPVEQHRIDVDGIATAYRVAGPPDAPVVLLPHGYPASSFEFRGLMPELGDRWRLIAPDAPGFGHSATPSPADFPYTFAAYADWLAAFADAVRLERSPSTCTTTARSSGSSWRCGTPGGWRR